MATVWPPLLGWARLWHAVGMTEPQFGGTEGAPPPNYQVPPNYQAPPNYPMPPQYPGPGGYVDPSARSAVIRSPASRCRTNPRSSPGCCSCSDCSAWWGGSAASTWLHRPGHRPAAGRARHLRPRRRHLGGDHRRVMILTDKVRDPQGDPPCVMGSVDQPRTTRLYAGLATGALGIGAFTYVGIVDPHGPAHCFRRARSGCSPAGTARRAVACE